MLQTQNDVIKRLEFLCRYIPDLKPDSALHDSALAEAHGLKHWLNNHRTPVYPNDLRQLCAIRRAS